MADAEGVDPGELTPPLYDVIEPDALDKVFSPARTGESPGGQLNFAYKGYDVTVRGDGHVSVEERDE